MYNERKNAAHFLYYRIGTSILRSLDLTGGFLLLRIFSVAISVSPRVCFFLGFHLEFCVSEIMQL